jgi:hypothetical protein
MLTVDTKLVSGSMAKSIARRLRIESRPRSSIAAGGMPPGGM